MTMRMMSPIPARVAQVLQDRLPAELDLIDAEEGEFSTPDVPNNNYQVYRKRPVTAFPCIQIVPGPWRQGDVYTDGFGQRGDLGYHLDLYIHDLIADAGENALVLQKRGLRYLAGMYRVLCVKYEGLQTIADPTRWAFSVTLDGTIDPGPDAAQAEGEIARTGHLPISVRRIEVRA